MPVVEGTKTSPVRRPKKKRKPPVRKPDSGEAARFLTAARTSERRKQRDRSQHATAQAARGEGQRRYYTDPRNFKAAHGRERLIKLFTELQDRQRARRDQERAQTLRGIARNREERERRFEAGDIDPEEYQVEVAKDRRRMEDLGALGKVEASSAASLPIKAIGNLAEAALYTPAGVYEAGKAVGLDVRDVATGRDRTPSRSKELAKLVARQTYEDLRHPLRNPGFTALSGLGVAAGGVGTTARVFAATGAARRASGASRVTQALARKPSEGGSLLRRPAPGRVEIAEGVHRNLSPNRLAAEAQKASLRAKKRLPESRMAGAGGRNLQETVGFERRRQEQILSDVDRAEASGLKQRGRKAGDVVNRAVDVVGTGTPLATRIARHERDLAEVRGSGPQARLHRARLEDEIKLLRRVDESGLVEHVGGVLRPTEKFRPLYERTVKSGERREGIVKELGLMSEEQLAARRAAPGRVFEGAKYEKERRPATSGLRGADETPPGELFFSYADKRRIKTGRPRPGTEAGMGAPRGNILHGEFTGEAIRQGRVPRDVIERVAAGEMEAQRHSTVLRVHKTVVGESVGPDEYLALPAKVRQHYRPVRVKAKPYSPDTRRFLDEVEAKKERGERLTREERGELDSATERARSHFFPPKREMSTDQALAAAEKGEVRFFDQRRLGGMNQPQQPITTIGKKAATVFDEFNSAKDIGDLFLRPAYLPANMAQQAALTIVAGVGPTDIALAARLKRLPPELKARMHGASGVGIAEGMPRERGRLVRGARNFAARKIGRVMDDEFRNLAFAKNARMLGYDTPAKVSRLLDPQAKGKVLDDMLEASKRTRDDMMDYQRLGNQERMTLSRAIRFYPFLKASGVYTGKFVRDHPIQATVLLQLSREGREAAEEVLGKLPFYRRGMFATGGIDEKTGLPKVVDPRAAQQFESPVQAGTLIEGAAKGLGAEVGLFTDEEAKAAREKLTLGDLLSPGLQAARDLIDPRDRLTGEALGYGEAFRENQRSSVDRFIEKMLRPPDPEEEKGKQLPSSRSIELRRFLAGAVFTPRPANVEELQKAAKEEGEVGLDPAEKAFRAVFQQRTAFWEAAKKLAPTQLEGGRLPEELRQAFSRKAEVERERARIDADLDRSLDRDLAKFEVEVKLLGKWGVLSSAKVRPALQWAQTASWEDIVTYRRKLATSSDYFKSAYSARILQARKFLTEQGAVLPD